MVFPPLLPLVHQQGAAAAGEAALDTPGQVPLCAAPVAVEHQLNGSPGGEFVVGGPKLQTVEGGNMEMLLGKGPGLAAPFLHLGTEGLVDRTLRNVKPVRVDLFPGRHIEGHPVAVQTDQQHCQQNG